MSHAFPEAELQMLRRGAALLHPEAVVACRWAVLIWLQAWMPHPLQCWPTSDLRWRARLALLSGRGWLLTLRLLLLARGRGTCRATR